MKNFPKLQLVTKDAAQVVAVGSSRSALRIVNFTELSGPDRRKVEHIVQMTAPGAGILGIASSPRSWDIRPIVVHSGDEESGPSIIRTLGPEVTLSLPLTSRLTDQLKRFSAFSQNPVPMLGWGVLEGQLWYRRPLVGKTLSEFLAETKELHFGQALAIAGRLVRLLHQLHTAQLVHGHVALSNIALGDSNEVAFLDCCAALGIVQANVALEFESFPAGYEEQSFPPETIRGEAVKPNADLYGLGRVFWDIFGKVRRISPKTATPGAPKTREEDPKLQYMMPDDTKRLRELITLLTAKDANARAQLPFVHEELVACRGSKGRGSSHSIIQAQPQPAPSGSAWKTAPQIAEPSAYPMPHIAASPTPTPVPPTPVPVSAPIPAPIQHQAPVIPRVQEQIERYTPQAPIQQQPPAPVQQAYGRNYAAEESEERDVEMDQPRKRKEQSPSSDNLPQRQSRPTPRQPMRPIGNSKKFDFTSIVFGALLIVAGVFAYRTYYAETPDADTEISGSEFSSAWSSGIPSEMSLVARVAVGDSPDRKHAERVILRSAFSAERSPAAEVVRYRFLRVAFDKQWEMTLSQTDRRAALTLALAKLLPKDSRVPSVAVEKLHPGIVLALVATSGNEGEEALNAIPIETLTKLPEPLNLGFLELIKQMPELKTGDRLTKMVSRLATGSSDNPEELLNFIAEDTEHRLGIVANLVALDAAKARKIIETVLHHPNFQLKQENLEWGRKADISNWKDVSSNDQLFIVAGIPPHGEITSEGLVYMLSHPAPVIRQYALGKALNQIPLTHKASFATLSFLRDQPQLLSGEQTWLLLQFLDKPDAVDETKLQNWLESKPSKEVLQLIVLGSASEKSATTLDFEVSRYLKSTGWVIPGEMLPKLIFHPDRLTRLYTYSQIFTLSDRGRALELLKVAYRKEKDAQFKTHIESMVKSLLQAQHAGASHVQE